VPAPFLIPRKNSSTTGNDVGLSLKATVQLHRKTAMKGNQRFRCIKHYDHFAKTKGEKYLLEKF
jgi:hypothetical protein